MLTASEILEWNDEGDLKPLLEAVGVTKRFTPRGGILTRKASAVVVLNQAALRLNCGETIGIWGGRGSGKSTLAHILARRIVPDAGEVRLNLSVLGAGPSRAREAVVVAEPRHQDDVAPSVVIAKALARAPAVLVIDEPAIGMESKTARDLIGLVVAQQAARGFASLLLSRDRDVLASMCSRVLALRDGRITAADESVPALAKSQ